MTASEFLTLSRIIEEFVADTEKVCGRKSTSFRMGLQGQVGSCSIPIFYLFLHSCIVYIKVYLVCVMVKFHVQLF